MSTADPREHQPRQRLVDRPRRPEDRGMDELPWGPPEPPPGKPNLDQLFQAFHVEHPEVYDLFVSMARQAKAAGRNRIGMKMLIEAARWQHLIGPKGDRSLLINNNFGSRYARKIMAENPDLAGIFEVRALHAERAA